MKPGGRIAVAFVSLSAVAFVGRMYQEGYTDTAVIPVKGDVPTVGFGMTKRPDGSPVRMGDRTTPVEALQRSLAHIQQDEERLRKCVTAAVFPGEWDVLLDHAYQYGVGATCASDVVRLTNLERYAEACDAYLQYRYITSGKPMPGWEPYSKGGVTRWRFDCSTPGNKVCRGVWTGSQRRQKLCLEAQ